MKVVSLLFDEIDKNKNNIPDYTKGNWKPHKSSRPVKYKSFLKSRKYFLNQYKDLRSDDKKLGWVSALFINYFEELIKDKDYVFDKSLKEIVKSFLLCLGEYSQVTTSIGPGKFDMRKEKLRRDRLKTKQQLDEEWDKIEEEEENSIYAYENEFGTFLSLLKDYKQLYLSTPEWLSLIQILNNPLGVLEEYEIVSQKELEKLNVVEGIDDQK